MQSANTSQIVTMPDIPELHNPDFLDILIPPPTKVDGTAASDTTTLINEETPDQGPKNAMIEALKNTTHQTLTQNSAPAFNSTSSPTLDAFQLLNSHKNLDKFDDCLKAAWTEDSNLTLRILWSIRSIHDGRANKEHFYQAFGWLYKHHPRTAIANLKWLIEPVSTTPKGEQTLAHGYWKDLLNILALAAVDELYTVQKPTKFLHVYKKSEKQGVPYFNRHSRNGAEARRVRKLREQAGDPATRIAAAVAKEAERKQKARDDRKVVNKERYDNLTRKLSKDLKFRALYIAVARLFSERLAQDVKILDELDALSSSASADDRIAIIKKLSLAGKWAPTPGGAHDRHLNISTAIISLLHHAQVPSPYPAALNSDLDPSAAAPILRAFYQRFVLTRLRSVLSVTEPFMSSKRWSEIRYNRVPSVCMKNNMETFYKHDSNGFQKYLSSVESGKQKISGATLFPHELVAMAGSLGDDISEDLESKTDLSLQEFKKRLKITQIRVIEAQWKTLIGKLKESGSIDNAVAICDVSGSMGYMESWLPKGANIRLRTKDVQPIFPALALSLVLAHLAKPPFNNGFITFSVTPEFVRLDLTKPLYKTMQAMTDSQWGMNTDFKAVFLKLILPLAIENKVPKEDMIKTLFVFSDMQFDGAAGEEEEEGEEGTSRNAANWKTNYDAIEAAYKKAGYDMPRIVYWDLANHGTVEVQHDREGVAMLNGFSPALLKVFMGETGEGEEEWEDVVDEEGNFKSGKAEEQFNPVSVMKKAVMKKSFDDLVVLD